MMRDFQVAEYTDKLGTVLKNRGKSYQHVRYTQGDKVFVQLQDRKAWSGPVKVFAQDGGDVWIFHNGNLIKLATCRVRPFVEPEIESLDRSVEPDIESLDRT